MHFRLYWLPLAVLLTACSGGSNSEEATSSFTPPVSPVKGAFPIKLAPSAEVLPVKVAPPAEVLPIKVGSLVEVVAVKVAPAVEVLPVKVASPVEVLAVKVAPSVEVLPVKVATSAEVLTTKVAPPVEVLPIKLAPPVEPVLTVKPILPVGGYRYGAEDGIIYSEVNEVPSSKQQTITIDGQTISFTATAGHLIAYDWKKAKTGGLSKDVAEAAIFYTAYTHNTAAKEKRPVTFVLNGGPGGAASSLDFGMFGPKADADDSVSGQFKPVDNSNTLFDKTDLVFVDPVGTGYSTAIKPHKNSEFWGVDSDAEVLRDFMTNYINANNRQSSPKYIYGVSYGGMRVPIIARLLLDDGTIHYAKDVGGKPANIVSGVILNSPELDYKTNCYEYENVSCGSMFPTYAMVANYHKKSSAIGSLTLAEFAQELRAFAARFTDVYTTKFSTKYSGSLRKVSGSLKWDDYLKTIEGAAFIDQLYSLTGIGKAYKPGDSSINNPWIDELNMNVETFVKKFDPAKGRPYINDGRRFLRKGKVDPAMSSADSYDTAIKIYLEYVAGHKTDAAYLDFNGKISDVWNFQPKAGLSLGRDRTQTSLTDLAYAKSLKKELKVLVQHGYYDLNTPFHKSELDIASAGLGASIPVSVYAGGHGLASDTTEAYSKVLSELRGIYDSPLPDIVTAVTSSALQGTRQ